MKASRWRLPGALGLLLTCASLASGAPARSAHSALDAPRAFRAQGDANDQKATHTLELMVLHATNSKKGIDKRIGDMPELAEPPFSSYDSYELLAKKVIPLKVGDEKAQNLPNGRTLKTKLLEVLPEEFVRISASINQPNGSEFLPLLEVKAKLGKAFIVAGQSYKNGILVLVFKVKAAE
jgi:hypothetical protein